MTGSAVREVSRFIVSMYGAFSVIRHVSAVPQTCDVSIVVSVASEILWKPGTLITSAEQQHRQQNKQGKAFLISLHLLSPVRPLGWFVSKAQ